MILFFRKANIIYAVDARKSLPAADIAKLTWLFSEAKQLDAEVLNGIFIGPRREMITPWSTNAVEITQNMGLEGIARIEEFEVVKSEDAPYDPMLRRMYRSIDQDIFTIRKQPDPVIYIDDIAAYNQQEGLALSDEEMAYLNELSRRIGRKLTDSEVFGFSQVNSEHCRHKIFNGLFIVDGEEMPSTLFGLIKKTTKTNPGRVVSAYKDNCAFLQGPVVEQFAPASPDTADYYGIKDFESVISVKAETHNFPTTVEPFNGAATGTGGEIRDRIAGGKGAFPVAGTAVYMTAYPRLDGGREWEQFTTPREWLYQTPEDILIKASNGASDFGNKFGQPLICGSVQTFEHFENGKKFGFDKVIMQAGGVGYGRKQDSIKDEPQPGDKVVLLGGDNYRIGMGGGAVSSVATGEYAGAIELNAVQRSNPEMQKRAYNAIRAASEETENPIISIHDHGAGGHLNCLSELVEATGGRIDMENLPIGDPTLSAKEIVGNESQERMGFVVKEENIDKLRRIAERERSPFYVIGEATGDMQFTFVNNKTGEKPIDLKLEDMFGKAPRTVLNDRTVRESYAEPQYDAGKLVHYIENVLQLEAVAAKDWLTNKVDRSVTGRVAKQQTAGSVQLPLNDCAVAALDYQAQRRIATALGHAPVAALADPGKGSVLAITEALTNIVFAPIDGGLPSVSLSANWMWPCKNEGEDARLYAAVQAASDYALALGINIPTGKDSLSMTQKYKDGEQVYAPGTVIITSVGEVSDVKKVVSPALKHRRSQMIYVDMSRDGFRLGGSSFAQVVGSVGMDVPTVTSADYFTRAFGAVQQLVEEGKVLSGHDVSAGGLITALLEMTFADNRSGMDLSLAALAEKDLIKVLFSEKPAVVLQVENGSEVCENLKFDGIDAYVIGDVNQERRFTVTNAGVEFSLLIDQLRDTWFKTSYLLDRRQSGVQKASERFANYKNQELSYKFPETFTGKLSQWGLEASRRTPSGIKAAVIREQGSNSEREKAWCMHLAGMDVKDVHMTDLISGRETLEDVNMIVFVGGFANSDVLNSAKGWAGAFLVNVEVQPTGSVLFDSMAGSRLGIWVAHGEGKFRLPYEEERYRIPLKYAYDQYPGNPNGSDYAAAAIVSADGRHLAMMPHIERSLRPWNWAYYPEERAADQVSPWIEAFVNARKWIEQRRYK